MPSRELDIVLSPETRARIEYALDELGTRYPDADILDLNLIDEPQPDGSVVAKLVIVFDP
jgi:hypothetical protein